MLCSQRSLQQARLRTSTILHAIFWHAWVDWKQSCTASKRHGGRGGGWLLTFSPHLLRMTPFVSWIIHEIIEENLKEKGIFILHSSMLLSMHTPLYNILYAYSSYTILCAHSSIFYSLCILLYILFSLHTPLYYSLAYSSIYYSLCILLYILFSMHTALYTILFAYSSIYYSLCIFLYVLFSVYTPLYTILYA